MGIKASGGKMNEIRNKYKHTVCGTETTMSDEEARTLADDPMFYEETYCDQCDDYFELYDFTWSGTNIRLGENR